MKPPVIGPQSVFRPAERTAIYGLACIVAVLWKLKNSTYEHTVLDVPATMTPIQLLIYPEVVYHGTPSAIHPKGSKRKDILKKREYSHRWRQHWAVEPTLLGPHSGYSGQLKCHQS